MCDSCRNRTAKSAIRAEIALLLTSQIAGNAIDFKMNKIKQFIIAKRCIFRFNAGNVGLFNTLILCLLEYVSLGNIYVVAMATHAYEMHSKISYHFE